MGNSESGPRFRSAVPVLEFHHVTKDYSNDTESVRALNQVSLSIEPGEFVALVGRSGCGKSTLLHLAGAMDFPSDGRVILDGVCTSNLTDPDLTRLRRDKVGFVFQSFQLLHTLSAAENVELPLLLAGKNHARQAALERLRWVGMEGLASRMPHQLSGGQMQRVAIARALIQSPKLLLADEPTGNLDSLTGRQILELMRSLNREKGVTVLMATHNAESVALATSIIRLGDGRVEDVEKKP